MTHLQKPSPLLVSLDDELPDPFLQESLDEARDPASEANVEVTFRGSPKAIHRSMKQMVKHGVKKVGGGGFQAKAEPAGGKSDADELKDPKPVEKVEKSDKSAKPDKVDKK